MKIQNPTRVNILGRIYSIYERTVEEDEMLREHDLDGYCENENALIVIRKKETEYGRNSVLRHELIHAFFNESGLGFNWTHPDAMGHDETTVDWFALQWPKIHKVFKELGCNK